MPLPLPTPHRPLPSLSSEQLQCPPSPLISPPFQSNPGARPIPLLTPRTQFQCPCRCLPLAARSPCPPPPLARRAIPVLRHKEIDQLLLQLDMAMWR